MQPWLQDPRPGEQSCAASGTAVIVDPVARNTLLITKYIPNQPSPLEPQFEGDVLRYGQKIRLLANPMAQVSSAAVFVCCMTCRYVAARWKLLSNSNAVTPDSVPASSAAG